MKLMVVPPAGEYSDYLSYSFFGQILYLSQGIKSLAVEIGASLLENLVSVAKVSQAGENLENLDDTSYSEIVRTLQNSRSVTMNW